ncbi:MAG TPA: ABC transporter permease [Gammaproteobacteria bacterium]|nr:ABC transporter permease [Gammaproteobacteria bacterium]
MLTITDLKYALRLMIRGPWFTLITVIVLSGGLGISLYTFATLNTLVYGELPVPEGGSIVTVVAGEWPEFAPLDAWESAQLRSAASGLSELGVWRSARALLDGSSSGRNLRTAESDWRVFEFARTPPMLGRGFVREDSIPGAEPVVVLSHEIWETEFAADAGVLGNVIRIGNRQARVVGVMPAGFEFPINTDVWLPLDQSLIDPSDYTGTFLNAYARLSENVSEAAAANEASAIVQRLRSARTAGEEAQTGAVSIMSFQQRAFGIFGDVVFGVLNLLACTILLLAAVNVGNLLLARINRRIREIGVRIALGAPRYRLILQIVFENFLLCGIGAALAVAIASRGLTATNDFMYSLLGSDMPFWWQWRLDGDALVVAGIILLATIIVVSVFPAISVSRTDPNVVLREGARGGGVNIGRVSRALVTIQVALITALLVVGSTATVIVQRIADFDFGIPVDDLLTVFIRLPADGYATPESQNAFRDRVLDEMRARPEVAAAMIMRQENTVRFSPAGAQYRSVDDYPGAWRIMLSDSPETIGPRVIEGRAFDSRDDAQTARTALVSESLARTHWPNESALGRTIEIATGDAESEQRTIVGVIGDIFFDPIGITSVGNAAIFIPPSHSTSAATTFIARHRGNVAQTTAAMYDTLTRIDPTLSPGRVQSYRDALDQLTIFGRTITRLFAGCGVFAILLAITGIFGMSSNAVVLRSHEIGVRRALGATHGNVIGIFLAQGSRQLLVGLVVSALLAAAALAIASQGFSLDGESLAVIAVTVATVVAATVLSSIYLSVRGVLKREPSAVLRLN